MLRSRKEEGSHPVVACHHPPMTPHLGFGITAQADPRGAGVAELAEALEALGYDELWANDGRLGSGLATLTAALPTTSRILLGLGVAPLSNRTPSEIAGAVEHLGLPLDRLLLGVGTGSGSSLAAVRQGVAALRRLLPDANLGIAALGPRMCELGGEIADFVLLNWAAPERIAWSRERIVEGARAAGREAPRVACYVRTAVGPDAAARLEAEATRYRSRPRPYARLFDAQAEAAPGVPGVAANNPDEIPALLAPYRAALDSCVVRALPATPDIAGWLAVAEAATLQR